MILPGKRQKGTLISGFSKKRSWSGHSRAEIVLFLMAAFYHTAQEERGVLILCLNTSKFAFLLDRPVGLM